MHTLVAIGLSLGLLMGRLTPSLFAQASGDRIQVSPILQLPEAASVRCQPEAIPEVYRAKLRSIMLFPVGDALPPDREIQLQVDSLGAVVTLNDLQWRVRPDGRRGLSNSMVFFQGDSARGTFVYEREDFPTSDGVALPGVTHRELEPTEISRALVLREWLLQRRCDLRRS